MFKPNGETLYLERMFNVPQKQVFNAWSSSEAMSSWFGLGEGMKTTAQVDFREGGNYSIVSGPYTVRGIYQKISPFDNIVFTWKWDGDQDVPDMLVTIKVEVTQQGSKMTLIHDKIADLQRLEQHKAGWEIALERLAKTLEA